MYCQVTKTLVSKKKNVACLYLISLLLYDIFVEWLLMSKQKVDNKSIIFRTHIQQ